MLRAELVGAPVFYVGSERLAMPTRRSAALLACLVERGRPVPRAELAELLWGPGRLRNLRQELYLLRKLPRAETWLEVGDLVSVRAGSDLEAVRRGAAEGDPDAALGLWRGPFLEGLDDLGSEPLQEWIGAVRSELEDTRARLVLRVVRGRLEQGDAEGAWTLLGELLSVGRTDEAVLRAAIEVQLVRGERDAALALWEEGERLGLTGGQAWAPLGRRLHGDPRVRQDAIWRTLGDGARRLARVLALDPEPLPERIVAALTGMGPHELAEAWEALASVDWLEGAVLAPTAVEAVTSHGPTGLLHGQLADLLEEEGVPPGRVGRHLAAAGRNREAVARYLGSGEVDGQLEDVERALALADTAEDRCAALALMVHLLRERGHHAEARRWLGRLDALGVETQAVAVLREAALQRALVEAFTARHAAAAAALEEAAELSEPDDVGVDLARGQLAFLSGRTDEGVAPLERVIASGDERRLIPAYNALGAVRAQLGDPDEAVALLRRGLAVARRRGDRTAAIRLLNNLGATHTRQGELEEATRRLREALQLLEVVNRRTVRTGILFNLSVLLLQQGRLGEARPVISDLLTESRDQPRTASRGCRLRAALEQAVGRYEEAVAWEARARDAFVQQGDPSETALSDFNIATASFLQHRDPAELDGMRDAVQRLSQLPRRDMYRPALFTLACFVPDPDEVERLLGSAEPDGLDSSIIAAATQRLALLRGDDLVIPPPERVEVQDDLYRLALHAATAAPDAPRSAERLREAVERVSPGLLSAQREALQRVVEGWLADPVRAYCGM